MNDTELYMLKGMKEGTAIRIKDMEDKIRKLTQTNAELRADLKELEASLPPRPPNAIRLVWLRDAGKMKVRQIDFDE